MLSKKIFISLLSLTALLFVFAGSANAASTSIRLQQPASQTNQNNFNITFVALDLNNQPISVQCFQDGVALGSPISLPSGGNTDNCQANLSSNGTHTFYAVATGSDTVTSSTVSVDYNNEKPGTPTAYNKTKDSCTYKITFTTANDAGKTIKVELFRTDDPSSNFNVDSGHEVGSVNIGSNASGLLSDNVSANCDKTYYYVIRAFDVYGNGSDVVGDSLTSTETTVVNPTTTAGQGGAGAIPVEQQVLGTGTTKEVLGHATNSAKPTNSGSKTKPSSNPVVNSVNWVLTHKKVSLAVVIILAGLVAYYLYRKGKKK